MSKPKKPNRTPQQMADEFIAEMQKHNLTPDQMLEVIAKAKKLHESRAVKAIGKVKALQFLENNIKQ